jgi:hypothetical protein
MERMMLKLRGANQYAAARGRGALANIRCATPNDDQRADASDSKRHVDRIARNTICFGDLMPQ